MLRFKAKNAFHFSFYCPDNEKFPFNKLTSVGSNNISNRFESYLIINSSSQKTRVVCGNLRAI